MNAKALQSKDRRDHDGVSLAKQHAADIDRMVDHKYVLSRPQECF